MPLIEPTNHMAVIAGLLGVVALGFLAERTPLGRRFSGAIIVLIAASVLANLNVLPVSAPVYGFVWTMLVPLAITLYLIRADLTNLIAEGGRTLLAFAIGAIGVLAGALAGIALLDLGPHEAELAGVFTATYTGGSLNFAAVADAIDFRAPSELAAAVAIDNVLGTGFFILLGLTATSRTVRNLLPWRSEALYRVDTDQGGETRPTTPIDLTIALFVAATVCAVGQAVAALFGLADFSLLFITVLIVLVATAGRRWLGRIQGAETVAVIFMYLFFAILAAGADVGAMASAAPAVFWFVLILFAAHLVFLFAGARLLRLNYGECIVASLACIGGPTIAVAFAALYGWRNLATPAVATGVLGYIAGNFIGVAVFQLINHLA